MGTGTKTALPYIVLCDIASLIGFMSDCGRPINRKDVQDLVEDFCRTTNTCVPQFENGRTGLDWCRNFEGRFKHVFVRRKCEGLDYQRATGLSQENVDNFHDMFNELVTKHDIQPENIWNSDVSGFSSE